MPYETETTLTIEEAKALAKNYLMKMSKGIWIYVIVADFLFPAAGIFYLSSGKIYMTAIMFLAMAFLPVMVVILTLSRSTREWKSNKLVQNAVYRFRFHESKFDVETPNGKAEVEYGKLFRILETKDHFYLFISKNQAYSVIKGNCSPELVAFLHDKS